MTLMSTCCNETYRRDATGWRYPWGALVPGAADLTLSDLRCITDAVLGDAPLPTGRPLTAAEQAWLAGDTCLDPSTLAWEQWGAVMEARIVGMQAPELHALTMMTVGDIAETAGVSKATIDSYRYRGYVPVPQLHRGRTPLWARPIVLRWLASHPSAEWHQSASSRPDPVRGPGPTRHPGSASSYAEIVGSE